MQSSGGGKVRIGIIGSGMAGSSAAYFARQALGDRAEILVYERNETVGGRVREIEVGGRQVAAGASIAHSSNRYFLQAVERLGLKQKHYGGGRIGIWNGRSFDFQTTGSRGRDVLRALLRYGLAPLRADKLVKELVGRLVRIYDLQEQGQAYATPQELFEALELYHLSQQTSREYFRQNGVGDRFVQEMVDGISRSNYLQASEIHALVNLVSLAGASMGGYLFSVEEGNSAVPRGLLEAAGAQVRTGTAVAEIARMAGASGAAPSGAEGPGAGAPGGEGPGAQVAAGAEEPGAGYRLTTASGDADVFDAVIIAAPLELAEIKLSGVTLPEEAKVNRPYQTTHVTFVVGRLNPGYFGFRSAEELPGTILTRESPEIPFSGIGTWGKPEGSNLNIHKLFSREELGDAVLDQVFAERAETLRLVWKAYPVLRPASKWPPFVLSEGLYYVNAMESGISTMETEMMGGRNVVNLLVRDLGSA